MVQLSADQAKRVGKCVKAFEGGMQNEAGNIPHGPIAHPYGFWARLTEADRTSHNVGYYSWERLRPDGYAHWKADGMMKSSYGEYSRAIELYGSKWCLCGSIVWMMPSVEYSHFMFAYAGGVLPATIRESVESYTTVPLYINQDAQYDQQNSEIRIYNPWIDKPVNYDDGQYVLVSYEIGKARWLITAQSCDQFGDYT